MDFQYLRLYQYLYMIYGVIEKTNGRQHGQWQKQYRKGMNKKQGNQDDIDDIKDNNKAQGRKNFKVKAQHEKLGIFSCLLLTVVDRSRESQLGIKT